MDLPEYLLEKVFAYLNWDDRARAACVCRRWQCAFYSPSLWRTIIFTPPVRPLTRMQYDIKAYRMSCCLRAIGPYVTVYRFVKSDNMFLLDRTLSLIAKFLESSPKPPPQRAHFSSPQLDLFILSDRDEEADSELMPVTNLLNEKAEKEYQKVQEEEEEEEEEENDDELDDYSEVGEQLMLQEDFEEPGGGGGNMEHLSDYASLISGDPDAEATLKLILRLQERELRGSDSDSSSDQSDVDIGSLLSGMRSVSVSLPQASPPHSRSQGRVYQRSQSCRYPNRTRRLPAPPPCVRTFRLDFHCEVDPSRSVIYGSGGALLATIRRVIRQLSNVTRLRLTDLFLCIVDARGLIWDLHKAAADSLLDLNIVHLHKLSGDGSLPSSSSTAPPLASGDWYLQDPRWLGARSHCVQANPLANLASLFPHLVRLVVAPTQLSGPMLLRLLYQTRLTEIVLVETDYTHFTVPNNAVELETGVVGDRDNYILPHPNHSEDFFDPEISQPLDDWDDLVDWADDVPHSRMPRSSIPPSLQIPLARPVPSWSPIGSNFWHVALILRPTLSVQLRGYFSSLPQPPSVDADDEEEAVVDVTALWPQPPSPVRALVICTTGVACHLPATLLSLSNPINVTLYADTLTTLIFSIDTDVSDSLTPSFESDAFADFNDTVRELPGICPSLSLIAFGGSSSDYLSIITLLILSRSYGRRFSIAGFPGASKAVRLIVQSASCRLVDETPPSNIPATVMAWYATLNAATGKDVARRRVAAERCISDTLKQPRWQFVSHSQFQSELSDYLN